MGIRFPDLQILFSRSHEQGRAAGATYGADQHAAHVAQLQGADEQTRRLRRVNESEKGSEKRGINRRPPSETAGGELAGAPNETGLGRKVDLRG